MIDSKPAGPPLMLSAPGSRDPSSELLTTARAIAAEFEFSASHVRRAARLFTEQLVEGLGQDGAAMPQIPSYVTRLPNGTEKGVCLAIDLGGTNLRVCSVELHGDSTYSFTQSKVAIPRSLMLAATYTDLFRFIAQQVNVMMEALHKQELDSWREAIAAKGATAAQRRAHCRSLGFTFSFAFDQYALNKGKLLYWTKGFDIPDAVGRDPCAMLQASLDELNLPLTVTALVNDTVGTLATRAYTSPGRSGALLGAIFGTGTNGAYLERISRITKLHARPEFANAHADDLMALNTEWGGFDEKLEVLPLTRYDAALDRESVNPGSQHFEKRISGLYLGELLRRILEDLYRSQPPVLTLQIPPESNLHVPGAIDSSFLSVVAQDSSRDLSAARNEISRVLSASDVSTADAQAIRILAVAIGRRAARLASVAIAGVVLQSGRLQNTSRLSTRVRLAVLFDTGLARAAQLCRGLVETLVAVCKGLYLGPRSPKPCTNPFTSAGKESLGSGSSNRQVKAPRQDEIDIGVDGSLMEFFPRFEEYLREALREIPQIGDQGEKRLRIAMAADGSGIGAALIAWAGHENSLADQP